ncbi:hypothetical protein V8E53_011943 [Lactarius tabidus]
MTAVTKKPQQIQRQPQQQGDNSHNGHMRADNSCNNHNTTTTTQQWQQLLALTMCKLVMVLEQQQEQWQKGIGTSSRASEGFGPSGRASEGLGHAFWKGHPFPASGPFAPAGRGRRAEKATCYFTDDLTIKAVHIGFHHIKKRHTGVNIANTILELLDQADVTLKNNHVRCYAHIINICSSHIVASVTSTPKSYISDLKVPIDSNIVTCDNNNNDNNELDGDLDCVIKELKLDDCYDGGNHPWLTHIKHNPIRNQCNWFTAKDCDGKCAPVQVPELQPLRDVKTQWDLVNMMLQHLREL